MVCKIFSFHSRSRIMSLLSIVVPTLIFIFLDLPRFSSERSVSFAQEAAWKSGGPYGGSDLWNLSISKTNPDVIYAGTPAGIYKTFNGGATWNNVWPKPLIKVVQVDPKNSDIVYAGRYDGLWRSMDGGSTWQHKGLLGVEVIGIDPNNSNNIYVGADFPSEISIFKSMDWGGTWETLISWDTNPDTPSWDRQIRNLNDLVVDPNNSSYIYVGVKANGGFGSFYKSADGGKTWTSKKLHSYTGDDIFSLAMGSDGIIFAVNTTDILRPALFKSDDKGETWSQTALPASGRLAVNPNDADVLYMGSYKSIDAGDTWSLKTSGLPENPSPWRRIVIDPLNDNRIYASLLGCGIYKSTDGAESWRFSSEGINLTYISDLAVDPNISDKAYAVVRGDGTSLARTINGGESWEYLDSSPGNLGAVAIDPQFPSIIWAGDGFGLRGRFYVYKSSDGGQAWTGINFLTIGGSSNSGVSEILIKPGDSNSILVGVDFKVSSSGEILGEGCLARTTDGGATWEDLDIPSITALAVDPDDPDVVYVGRRRAGEIHRYSNVWGNWSRSNISPTGGIGDVRDIEIDSASRVYAAASDGLWRRDGLDWTRLSGLPTDDITSLAIHKDAAPGIIYLGTQLKGVFTSEDEGNSWEPLNEGLGNLSINKLSISSAKPRVLYAGTAFGGVWRISLEKDEYTIAVVANPQEGGMVAGGGTFEHGTQITVTATANENYFFSNWTEEGTVVSTNAGYTFTLKGDRALEANFWEAQITLADAITVLQVVAGVETTVNLFPVDLVEDGIVGMADAVMLLQCLGEIRACP